MAYSDKVIDHYNNPRNVGSFDAKDATVGADGPAIIKLTVTGTAKVDAMGAAAVGLDGSATRAAPSPATRPEMTRILFAGQRT